MTLLPFNIKMHKIFCSLFISQVIIKLNINEIGVNTMRHKLKLTLCGSKVNFHLLVRGKSLNELLRAELHIYCWYLWASLIFVGQQWSGHCLLSRNSVLLNYRRAKMPQSNILAILQISTFESTLNIVTPKLPQYSRAVWAIINEKKNLWKRMIKW